MDNMETLPQDADCFDAMTSMDMNLVCASVSSVNVFSPGFLFYSLQGIWEPPLMSSLVW